MPGIAPRQVRAYAKVNLALAVGPPIPQGQPHAGMHPIASWMHSVSLHDDIEIAPAESTSYDIAWSDGGSIDWAAEDDLCVRSHRAVESAVGRALPIALRVRKSIPAGGGLGGGSSDAAAVIQALRQLFELPLDDEQIIAIGHALGSDIPFFIDTEAWNEGAPPRPAIVNGLGEQIERVARLDDHLTLVLPEFGCPTGAVYRAFDAEPTGACDAERVRAVLRESLRQGSVQSEALFNDLAGPAERVEQRLGAVRRSIAAKLGVPVHVSGSGSTLYIIEPDAADALVPIPGESGVRVVRTRLT